MEGVLQDAPSMHPSYRPGGPTIDDENPRGKLQLYISTYIANNESLGPPVMMADLTAELSLLGSHKSMKSKSAAS